MKMEIDNPFERKLPYNGPFIPAFSSTIFSTIAIAIYPYMCLH